RRTTTLCTLPSWLTISAARIEKLSWDVANDTILAKSFVNTTSGLHSRIHLPLATLYACSVAIERPTFPGLRTNLSPTLAIVSFSFKRACDVPSLEKLSTTIVSRENGSLPSVSRDLRHLRTASLLFHVTMITET